MIKLSVSQTQWSSLLARTRALILYIPIWIFDFGPEKLPGLSRNGRQDRPGPSIMSFQLTTQESCYCFHSRARFQ